MSIQEQLQKYPHNTDCGDKFYRLLNMAYDKYVNNHGKLNEDDFIQFCLALYGGTIAGALIDYIYNHS